MDLRPHDVDPPDVRSCAPPIAVFAGRAWFGCAADPCFLFVVAFAGIAVTTAFARFLPWPSALAGGSGLEGLVLLFGLAGLATLIVIQRWALARIGHAELFADRLVIKHQRQFLTIRLSEIDAFDDHSADYVRLRFVGKEGSRQPCEVTVPTPDELGRAALVGALAGAGAPRPDGQDLDARVRVPAEDKPALLSVTHAPMLTVGVSLTSFGALVAVLASGIRPGVPAWILLFLALIGLPVLAALWSHPRTGTVHFHDDRIVVSLFGDTSAAYASNASNLTLAWDDLIGWRSTSPAYLRLVLRPGLLRDEHSEPSVPTPTRELRIAIEALLAARGVPRA